MNKSELKNGCVVELRNGSVYILKNNKLYPLIYDPMIDLDYFNDELIYELTFLDFDDELQRVKRPIFDIIRVDNSNHLDINWTWERKEPVEEPVLTDKERDYLKAVIEPVKDKVQEITKIDSIRAEKVYIYIKLKNGDCMNLYDIDIEKEYVGMELDKKYTLKELGLE